MKHRQSHSRQFWYSVNKWMCNFSCLEFWRTLSHHLFCQKASTKDRNIPLLYCVVIFNYDSICFNKSLQNVFNITLLWTATSMFPCELFNSSISLQHSVASWVKSLRIRSHINQFLLLLRKLQLRARKSQSEQPSCVLLKEVVTTWWNMSQSNDRMFIYVNMIE